MNPLLAPIEIPVKVVQRGIRELETLSDVARSIPRVIELMESLDGHAARVVELGERLDSRAEQLLEMGGNVNEVGLQILTEARLVQERAGEVVDRANAMIAIIPTVERALDLGQPLEGTINRIARAVDRLPGGGTQIARKPTALDPAQDPEPTA